MTQTVENNGHTFSITFNGFTESNMPKIANGGLPGEFNLIGIHFHWGDNHRRGSEHHVNDMAYPAEVGSSTLMYSGALKIYREPGSLDFVL